MSAHRLTSFFLAILTRRWYNGYWWNIRRSPKGSAPRMLKKYTETFPVLTRDCDLNGAWRPGAILQSMQEAGGAHSALLGVGRNELILRNLAWVLTRIEVEMDRYPRIGDKVTMETFPTPLRRWFFPRYFVVRDEGGAEIGRAASLWVLLDLTSRRMVQPGEVAALMPDNSDLPAPLGLPAPVTEVGGTLLAEDWYPRYTDMDANVHVNTTRYIDWACDALGIDAMRESELARFTITYTQEIRPGQKVHTELHRLGNDFSYSGFVDGDRHFDLGGRLRPRG